MRKHVKSETIVVQSLNWFHVKEVDHLFASSDIEFHVNFDPGALSDWSPDDPPYYMGIFAGPTLVGVATIGLDDEKDSGKRTVALLSDVYITPSERNKGYGTILVKSILSMAPDQGYEQVNIEVLDPELLGWYEQMGFRRTENDWTATFHCHS